MNRATGYAYAPAETPTLIGCFVYNGTAERIASARLSPDADAAWIHYREDVRAECTCAPGGAARALLFVDPVRGPRSDGFWWEGTVCTACAVITSTLDLSNVEVTAGQPEGAHIPDPNTVAAPEPQAEPAPRRRAPKDTPTAETPSSIEA